MAFAPQFRGRCWIGVLHIKNFINAGMDEEFYKNPELLAQYLIETWETSAKKRKAGVAICVSAQGVYHAHVALYTNTTTLKRVSDIMFNGHIEPQLGTKEQLTAYLNKEGKYAEKGEQVLYTQGLEAIEDNQGKRNDLGYVEQLLNDGLSPEQIFAESFCYRKFERMIKAEYLARRIRETPLVKSMNNEWHFGKSGSGKTFHYIKLCEQYSPDEVYLCNDYSNSGSSGGGFDFYANNPARIIILDEFRGNIGYAQLLSMLDVYSRNQQHCRYQNTYNLWESVIICTIYPPEEVYEMMVSDTNKHTDSFRQLMRRLNTIVYHYINDKGEYKTFSLSSDKYVDAANMIYQAEMSERNSNGSIDDFEPCDESNNPFTN